MTPIISPWVFYLINVCSNVSMITAVITFIGSFGFVIYLIVCGLEWKKPKFKDKKLLIGGIIMCAMLTIFIPTESTLTKMIVAQNVTYERVEMVGDTVQDVYEDIISLVDNNGENSDEE